MDEKLKSGEALEIIAPDTKVTSFNHKVARNGSEFFVFTGMCGGVSVDFFVYNDNEALYKRALTIDKGARYMVTGESYPRVKETPSGEKYITIGVKVYNFRKIADREEDQATLGAKKKLGGFGM